MKFVRDLILLSVSVSPAGSLFCVVAMTASLGEGGVPGFKVICHNIPFF